MEGLHFLQFKEKEDNEEQTSEQLCWSTKSAAPIGRGRFNLATKATHSLCLLSAERVEDVRG